jgi:hypothetical protein
VQRALELAGLGELGVERLRHFERIGHRGIVIGRVSLRALTPKIERYQRAELARLLDRLDVSEQITGCWIDRPFHAGAVIGFDTLQIQVHQLRGVDLPRLNRAVDVDDCRFFEIKFLRRRQRRPEPEENRHQKRR